MIKYFKLFNLKNQKIKVHNFQNKKKFNHLENQYFTIKKIIERKNEFENKTIFRYFLIRNWEISVFLNLTVPNFDSPQVLFDQNINTLQKRKKKLKQFINLK